MKFNSHIQLSLSSLFVVMAMIVSGCSSDNDIDPIVPDDTSHPMIFGSSVTATRAMIESTDALQSLSEGFGVYGTKNTTDLFLDQQVKYNSASAATDTKWEYSPIKYWDVSTSGVTYNFSAYAPYVGTTASTTEYVSYDTSSHAYTVNNLPQYQDESTAYDLLVADNQTGAYSYFTNGIVNFNFYHKLAKFVVRATKEESESLKNTDYYITGVSFGGTGLQILKDDNSVLLTAAQNSQIPAEQSRTYTRDVDATTQSDVFNTGWTAATGSVSFYSKTTSELVSTDAVAVNSTENIEAGTNYSTILTKIVTPFDLASGSTIPVTVSYVTKVGDAAYSSVNTATASTTLSNIKPGYVYQINLKVGAVNVSAAVLEIQQWTTETAVENSVYNW